MKTIKNIPIFNIIKRLVKLIIKLIIAVLFVIVIAQTMNNWTIIRGYLRDCSKLSLINIIYESDLECIREQNLKSVQLLTELYESSVNWDGKIGRDAFKDCPESRCFAFRYRSNSQVALESSDAVVVHAPNLNRIPSRETYHRRSKQLWVYYTIESQRVSLCLRDFNITDFDDWFNITRTVKSKYSYFFHDIKQLERYEIYQNAFQRYKTRLQKTEKEPINKKLAFWFVSNCNAFSHRQEYVQEMQKYIDIDIYGRCLNFNNSIPDPCKAILSPINRRQCFRDIFKSYKFYLSFENAKCDHYITEKYYKLYNREYIFDADLIPVVRGAKLDHYLDRAPSNYSFIFADAFSSPKSLANYLSYLDHNQTAYEEYFSWKRELIKKFEDQETTKKSVRLKPYNFLPFCELCEKLHNEEYLNNKSNPIVKISDYYNPLKHCARDEEGQSEEQLLNRMERACFWADYHQKRH